MSDNHTRKQVIKDTAAMFGWVFFEEQTDPPMLSFKSKDMKERINVYHTTMTVVTCLNHPKQGKKSLVRRDVSDKMLQEIFRNPRVHTGHGYYTHKNNYVKTTYPFSQETIGRGRLIRNYGPYSGGNAGSTGDKLLSPEHDGKNKFSLTSLANSIKNRAIKFLRSKKIIN